MIKIKSGCVTVKVYETKHKTWQIYCTFGGIRYLKHRTKKEEALEEAKKLADEIALGLSPTSGIARKKWEAILEAEKKLIPFNVSIEEVIRQYVEKHKGLAKRVTIDEVARACLAAKQEDGCSIRYARALKFYFSRITAEFGIREIATIETAELDNWLRKQKSSARSRNNLRDSAITLFRWAQIQGYLPSGKTAPEMTSEAKGKSKEITILTPDQFKELLQLATERNVEQAILYLTIGAFSGLRSAEMERLEWQDIIDDHIEISAAKAKTASRRIVPLSSNLKAWLKLFPDRHGRVIPKGVSQHVQPLVQEAWGEWSRNCLRHSFISYRLAQIQNVAQVALEAGNSPQKVFSNYRSIKLPDGRLITKELAEKWFSIVP